ncbi:MAG: response regulator, partial [Candidatus Magnetominusculus sp. LBB02]|nr:response regulator [Candidatus Magnetominusculus sp. LBB02]
MPKRLLLADDSITIQKVVELILSEEDFQIASVNDGQEALDKLETFKPTLVLADVEMPKVNGYSLCKQIKSNENTKHIPVILLVGAFEPLNENNFKDCGASDYLIKPFESQEFLNKIHAALAGSVSDAEVTALEEPVRPASKKEDVEELDDVNIFDDTGVFEEGQAASDDTSELQSFSDSDLTTRELKDVLDSLTGGSGHSDDDTEPKALNNDDIDALFAKKASDNTAVDKQPKVMDNDDIDALFAK